MRPCPPPTQPSDRNTNPTRHRHRLLAAAVVASFCATTALGQPTEASFQGLGDLPGGAFSSQPFGVSADGSVVVGFSFSDQDIQAFRWTQKTGMVVVGDLPGGSFFSRAFGVSADGSVVVGGSSSASGFQAFRWTQETGMVGLGDLPGGSFSSEATQVSTDGSVVVGYSRMALGTEAFRWTQETGMVGLGDLPGGLFNSKACAVSADGSVVVGFGTLSNLADFQAFRWTQETGMVSLGVLPGGLWSDARDLSADGSVVVGLADLPSGVEAFRWTQATGMVALGKLPGADESNASGVSADGSIVVGQSIFEFMNNETTVWDSVHGIRSLKSILVNDLGLDLAGWTLSGATDISDDRQVIVGAGLNPGLREAWRAVIPCTPLACYDGDVCTFDECVEGACTHQPNVYGDVDHDGDVDLFDLFCILDGFAGDFSVCSFTDDDLDPCQGDADIDLFDLFAVLNTFAGIDPCCGGLP